MPVVIGENGRRLVTIADILTLRRNPSHAGYPELRLRHRLIRFIFYHAANDSARLQAFPLERAGAARVASAINTFWGTRWPGELAAQHQVRVTFDDNTNTVFVQAAPNDLRKFAS